jgi:hypothetical protein
MDFLSPVNIYGAIVLVIMMLFYFRESRGKIYTLLFGIACFFSSSYGFLSGAWSFGVIELAWGLMTLRKYVGLGGKR